MAAATATFADDISWTESDGFPLADGKAIAFLQHVDTATVHDLIK